MCHLEKGRGVTSGVMGVFAINLGNQGIFPSAAQAIAGQRLMAEGVVSEPFLPTGDQGRKG